MTATTIKVSSETRDRLKRQAQRAGTTLGAHLDRLAELADREERFDRLRDAVAATSEADRHSYAPRPRSGSRPSSAMPAGPDLGSDPGSHVVPGTAVWAALDAARGREQGGRRPAVVVAGRRHLEIVDSLTIVVPVTSVDRGWPNHVALADSPGLDRPSWAMTEQVRTLTRSRVHTIGGTVSPGCLAEIRQWVADFLDLRAE